MFKNRRDIDLTNYVQKVSDNPQEVSAEILYDNPVDKPTETVTKQYVDSKFALANHNHDNRYYTEQESDTRFAPAAHNHNDLYYTETESDARFANVSHNHDNRYYTENESDTRFAQILHNHDDRYFTEMESDARFAQLVHNHDDRYFTESESDLRFAPLVHNHDDRYYTETESDTRFAPLSHNHDERYYTENEIDGFLDTKMNAAVTTLGSSSSTALHSVNNRTLSLKQIKQGASISVTENFGDILISNLAPNVTQVDDTQITSTTAYSSQKLTTDYVPYSNIHGSTRTANNEIYNSPYINTLETALTSAINGKASLTHTHNISEINNLTTTLNLKLSTSVTTLGAGTTTLHTVNGAVLGIKTLSHGTGVNMNETNGLITISNTAPNVDQIDDTQTTSTTAFSSQKTENTYFPISNVHGSFRTANNEVYNSVYVNTLQTTLNNSINQKLSTSVTTLGASGTVLYTVNGDILGLKTITHNGTGISITENNGIISITNTAPYQNVIDDLQTTSATCFSSNKSETDYFKKADLHGTARSGAGEAYSVPYINTLIPTSATEDLFITTTLTSGTNQLSTKLSTGPVRFGHNTPTSMHANSSFFGVSSGSGTSNSNVITAVGRQAAEGSGVGTACTCVGYRAGDGSTGVRNTFMGHLAGNGITGSDLFALGEGSMDGGTCNAVTGIGRYAFRGATANNSIGLGINVMGSGFGFHTYATNSVQRSGSNKFLVGDNTNTNNWTTTSPNTGNPYLLDGTMGSNDSVRSLKINANEFHLPTTLPFLQPTPNTQIWKYFGFLVQGAIPANANFVPAVLGAHKFY